MITYDQVLNEAKKVCTKDRVNPGSVYTAKDGSHCVAAQIMKNLGVEPPEFCSSFSRSKISSIPQAKKFEVNAILFMEKLQKVADSGRSWKYALDHTIIYQ